MKTPHLLIALGSLLFATVAQSQWLDETYNLKGGWNAVAFRGDAPGAIGTLFPAEVIEVWRWNPNPNQVQFTSSPLLPTQGTPEWSVWKRDGSVTTLTELTGQSSYLVRCSGTAADSYVAVIRQSPEPPSADWVRNGANLLGFPTLKNGSYPTFSNYFATFPVAIAANTKIYKYIGGELGPTNPQQVFAPASEQLDRTQAYWFSAEVVGNFYAPLEISLTSNDGLAFGRTGAVITARIRNRTDALVTLTLAPNAGRVEPPGQELITGSVPLTRRTFDTNTLLWTETPIVASYTEPIGPQSTVELSFGINRADGTMAGAAPEAFFASFLRITESSNLVDIYLPATARKSSLAGLWVGDIKLTNVSSEVSNGAKAAASVKNGEISEIRVSGGGFGYDTAPDVTIADPPTGGTTATATATVENGAVTAITIDDPGSDYAIRSPKVTIALPPPLPGTSTPRVFPLRTLLHVESNGAARLLSQVFLGQLDVAPNYDIGLCAFESLLKQDAKASAQRLVAAHMPLDQVIANTSGSVAVPGSAEFPIMVAYTDPTNPFVHQYHPDHDNKKPRATPLEPLYDAGVESYDVNRACTFTFTATAAEAGSSATSGWGSTVIGGTYTEVITGIHKNPIQLNGTFELRRASEIGALLTE